MYNRFYNEWPLHSQNWNKPNCCQVFWTNIRKNKASESCDQFQQIKISMLKNNYKL